MILKVNTHCHSTISDGAKRPEDMIQAYERLGYDALFLTDHNSKHKLWQVEERASGLVVFYGKELSNDPLAGQHVNEVRTGRQKLRILNHPSRYRNTVQEVEKMAEEFNLDCVEVTEHGRLYPKYLKVSLPHIASDDAHNFRMVGDSYTLVEVNSKDPDSILTGIKFGAIKQGKIRCGGAEFEKGFINHFFPKASGVG